MRTHPLADVARWVSADVSDSDGSAISVGPDVVVDSRLATPGCLFVALPGEHANGHDFIPAAAAAGAAAVLASELSEAPIPHLLVDDPVIGLSNLARQVVKQERQRGMTTLALTGSSGKTSTKDLLAQVLEAAAPTVAPHGSFNNEIGVPLTATRVDEHTQYLVCEMGARGRGHLSWLASIVPPDIGVILNVGTAHVGEFGSVEAIADSKAELIRGLGSDNWAVLNADDPRVVQMAPQTSARLAWFTTSAGRPPAGAMVVTVRDIVADDLQRHRFSLVVDGQQTYPVQLPMIGAHQVSNAAAAATAAIVAGVDPGIVAAALSRVEARSRWRMELQLLAGEVAVLNDAYNANPDSMTAALTAAQGLKASRRTRYPAARLVVVLGDMLELGEQAQGSHRNLGEQAVGLGADEIVAVGSWASDVVAGATAVGGRARVATRDEVAASLRLSSGDLVLIKGSRGIALEHVADELRAIRGGAE